MTADDANVTPFKVKARTGSEWWYKAKAVKLHEDKPKVDELKGVPIKVGDVVTLAPGAFARRDLGSRSICTADSASASPSDASDDASDEAAKNDVNVVGCCAVTKQNFKGGAKVMRGPDWKWSDQDGGPGKLSKVRI